MAITGYSFLSGNHEVYLLAPLKQAGAATFEGDWFVNDTLQYHGLFSLVAAGLFQLDVARSGFLVIFFGLVLAMVWAWWRITKSLGGGVPAFLASVVVYHILLGDRALGFYSLLQDGQFNAGNVAAVALLVGIAMWLEKRLIWAGVAFGMAGLFHLNYGVVCPALWVALMVTSSRRPWSARRVESSEAGRAGQAPRLRVAIATLLALLPSLANVALALPAKLGRDGSNDLPLDQFVQLYVKLRHPHHYDPSAWPWWVWLAFLLPIPLAVLAWRKHRAEPAWNEAAKVWVLLMGLQLVALVFAGVIYLNETAIQMSLWRFSPHAKLLAVTAAVAMMRHSRRSPACQIPASETRGAIRSEAQHLHAGLRGVALILSLAVIVIFARGNVGAIGQNPADGGILAAADWAKANTDRDAVFLVPPGAGSAFPVNARRGHVVSFKLVPQLSDELADWDRRLRAVLAVESLSPYAGGLTGYATAQKAMDDRYGELSAAHLFDVARRYGARYVLTLNPLDDAPSRSEIWRGLDGARVYDVSVGVAAMRREGGVGTAFDRATQAATLPSVSPP